MRVTEIIVSAGRTFSHPYESYSNLRPAVTVKAELADGENFEEAVKDLQRKAETMVEDHKQNMLKSLHALEAMQRREREIVKLEHVLKTTQEELSSWRSNPIENLPGNLFAPDHCQKCGETLDDCRC